MSSSKFAVESPARALHPCPSPTKSSHVRYGMHAFVANGVRFVIDSKYQPRSTLGQGAYGVVISAMDKKSAERVAIKKISNAFADLIDAKRVLRELKLLNFFNHENLITLIDMVDPSTTDFDDIYMVMEFMETDLHKIIYSKNELSDEHVQYFLYQILSGLKYMHSANVLHRDLKPGNILLNSNCELKICDFGLARGVTVEDDAEYSLTEYVVTRWYRAPEVMISCKEYDFKLDIWSVGCIFAELLQRDTLFPGKDYIDQMRLIFDLLGTPSPEDMEFVTNSHARRYIRGLCDRKPRSLAKLIPNASPIAIDLLESMLKFNPSKRISVDEALAHPYLAELVEELDNHKATRDAHFTFEWEHVEMTKETLQNFVLGEVCKFRPSCATRLKWTEPDYVTDSNRDSSAANDPTTTSEHKESNP